MRGPELEETPASLSSASARPRSWVTQVGGTVSVPDGVTRLVSRQDLEECEAWPRAFAARCKDHRYYEILEETLEDGFEHYYLMMEDLSGNVRAVQPLFFVRQNLTEGVAGRVRALINAVRRKTCPLQSH